MAGTPATVIPGSVISLTTTALAPIATLSAIFIFPIIFAPVPIKTLSPIVAAFGLPPVAPIFTPSWIRQFFPIVVVLQIAYDIYILSAFCMAYK